MRFRGGESVLGLVVSKCRFRAETVTGSPETTPERGCFGTRGRRLEMCETVAYYYGEPYDVVVNGRASTRIEIIVTVGS